MELPTVLPRIQPLILFSISIVYNTLDDSEDKAKFTYEIMRMVLPYIKNYPEIHRYNLSL